MDFADNLLRLTLPANRVTIPVGTFHIDRRVIIDVDYGSFGYALCLLQDPSDDEEVVGKFVSALPVPSLKETASYSTEVRVSLAQRMMQYEYQLWT